MPADEPHVDQDCSGIHQRQDGDFTDGVTEIIGRAGQGSTEPFEWLEIEGERMIHWAVCGLIVECIQIRRCHLRGQRVASDEEVPDSPASAAGASSVRFDSTSAAGFAPSTVPGKAGVSASFSSSPSSR